MKKIILLALVSLCCIGCTTVNVRPVSQSIHLTRVCIQRNEKVAVSDFLQVIRDGFSRHGIATAVFSGDTPPIDCEYILTYTALRSWDFSPYMYHAELRIEKAGLQIAYGEYHLKGRGGFDLGKWDSTRSKMDPVIDKMLAGIE